MLRAFHIIRRLELGGNLLQTMCDTVTNWEDILTDTRLLQAEKNLVAL